MEHVVRGKLKLKGGSKLKVSADGHKKSKKSKKSKKEKRARSEDGDGDGEREDEKERVMLVTTDMTPAQRRYEELRKKREREDIEKVAGKTYRERVEELNQYLGRLTEHHDIPRVSAAGNG